MGYLNLLSFDTWGQIGLVFSVAFYLLECYMGYKGIRWLAAIVGFFVGFFAGFAISAGMYTQDGYVPAAIGIAAGVALALIAFRLYLIGVFIFCGTLAAQAISNLPLSDSGAQGTLQTVLCILGFIIVGILAVKFAKMCIILVTSITGAINAVNLLRTPIAALDENMVLRIAVIILVAITGILVQRATTR